MLHLVFSAEALPRCLQIAGAQDHIFMDFAGAELQPAGAASADQGPQLHVLDQSGRELFAQLLSAQHSVSWY